MVVLEVDEKRRLVVEEESVCRTSLLERREVNKLEDLVNATRML